MKRRSFVRPEAQTDIREAARWYEDREPGLGIRFIREVRTSVQHIADNPLMFPIIEEDVRRALIHKFPYSIYFAAERQRGRDHRGASSTSSTRCLEIAYEVTEAEAIAMVLLIQAEGRLLDER